MKKQKDIFEIIKNASFLILVQTANYLVPFIVLPYISNKYTQDIFGSVLIILSICQLAYIITEFGFNVSLVDRIKKGLTNKKIIELNSNVIKIRVITCLLYSIIVCFFIKEQISYFYMSLVFLTILFQGIQPIWYFIATEQFKCISKILLITKLLQVPFFFFFLLTTDEVVLSFILSLAISQLIGACYSVNYFFVNVNERFNFSFFNCGISQLFIENYGFFFSRIYSVLPYYIGSPLIGRLYGIDNAALFGAGESIGKAAKGFTGSVVQAFYPRISELKDSRLFFLFYIVTVLVLSVICSILSNYSELILTLIFGEQYKSASDILNLSFVMVVLSYSSNLLGYPLFAIVNRTNIVNKITFISFVFFMVLIISMIFYNFNYLFFLYAIIYMEVFSSVIKIITYMYIKNK